MTPITLPTPPAKSIFKSKTSFAQALVVLAGALGSISPQASAHIASHANTILLLSGALGLLLRRLTHGRVTLFGDSPSSP